MSTQLRNHEGSGKNVKAHLNVLEQVEDAELLLTNGSESRVTELKGALALAVDGPQVVELLLQKNKSTLRPRKVS